MARSSNQFCPHNGGDAEVQGETTMLFACETGVGGGSSLRPTVVCPVSQAFVAQDNELVGKFATKTCDSKPQISKLTQGEVSQCADSKQTHDHQSVYGSIQSKCVLLGRSLGVAASSLSSLCWGWFVALLHPMVLAARFFLDFGFRDARVLHTICNNGVTFRDSAHGSISWVLASGYKEFIRKQTPEVQRDDALLGSLWRKLESSQRLDFRTSEALVVQALASIAVDRGSVCVCSFRFTSYRDLPHHEITVVGLPVSTWEQMREIASEAYNRSKASSSPRFISQQQAPNNLDDKDLFLTLGQGPEFFAVAHSNRLAHWYEYSDGWENGYWMPYNANEATWSAPAS